MKCRLALLLLRLLRWHYLAVHLPPRLRPCSSVRRACLIWTAAEPRTRSCDWESSPGPEGGGAPRTRRLGGRWARRSTSQRL